jgi:putative membrane protein
MERKLKDYAVLMLKGMGMGAADVVPGVSGGTIAFIVGIYDELINSIKSINLESLKLFFSGKWATFWKKINGNFLFFLLAGIGISVFSLAKLITWLLVNQPILVWSFFFGLVLASTWFVSKDIKEWKNWKTWVAFVIGVVVAFYITVATPAETPSNLLFIFLCGAIAICAMILPGISGSFILVLLGKYFFIMDAVKTLDVVVIAVFGAGVCIGITSFSHILSYALAHFRNITLAVLTGFMLGSLNKVWPWKEVVETFVDSHGEVKPLIETNILPNAHVPEAVVLMVAGFFLVYFLEKLSAKTPVR